MRGMHCGTGLFFSCIGLSASLGLACGDADEPEVVVASEAAEVPLGATSEGLSLLPLLSFFRPAPPPPVRLKPVLECVDDLGRGRFRAHWGYENRTSRRTTVPIGWQNRLVPGTAAQGQPVRFQDGVQHEVFTNEFSPTRRYSGSTWYLDGQTATANKLSPRCPVACSPAACDDGNLCTEDGCATSGQCAHVALPDGTACGVQLACSTGQCVPVPPECLGDTDCSDGVFCNGAEVCDAGACRPGVAPICDDGQFCNGVETCDDGVGACLVGAAPDCSDGNACNGFEVCDQGTQQCAAGAPLLCLDDGNTCTVETCEPTSGCGVTVASDGTSCNDSGEICLGGVCQLPPPVVLNAAFVDTGYFVAQTSVNTGTVLGALHFQSAAPRTDHQSYFTGNQNAGAATNPSNVERRSYFVFDVSAASAGGRVVQSAVLRLWAWKPGASNGNTGCFTSTNPEETFALHSVSSHSAADVMNAPFNQGAVGAGDLDLPIWTDLGDGAELGSSVFTVECEQNPGLIPSPTATNQSVDCSLPDTPCGKWIEVPLNATAASQIQFAAGPWVFGGRVASIAAPTSGERREWLHSGTAVDLPSDQSAFPDFLTPAPQLIVTLQ
jgi:hypothetical protein